MNIKKLRFLFVCILIIQLIVPQNAFCTFKKLKENEWKKIFQEMKIEPSSDTIKNILNSNDTIGKVQNQSKGSLKIKNWIEVFTKLGIEPKKEMTNSEWQTFFDKINLNYNKMGVDSVSEIEEKKKSDQLQTKKPTLQEGQQEQSSLNESLESDKWQPRKISLDLRGTDIVTALNIISKKADMGVVISNSVKGKVTTCLKDIDAFVALRMILEMNNLAYVQYGKIFKVMTAREYKEIYGKEFCDITETKIIKLKHANVEKIEKTVQHFKSNVGKIISDSRTNSLILIDTPKNINTLREIINGLDIKMKREVFSLNYVKAKNIVEKVKSALNTTSANEIHIDERANQIIITDSKERIKEIERFIKSLDKPHKEVLIEARIVQIVLNREFKMGVNWQSIFNKISGYSISGKVIGNVSNLSSLPPIPLGHTGVQLDVGSLEADNFNVVLDLLESVGKTNIISSPRIVALENEEAKILVGTKEAYVTYNIVTSGSGVTTTSESIQFVDVGVKLFVTPAIGEDGYITMKIRPEVSSVDRTINTSQGNVIPIVRTSEAETFILVKDGVTIVLAGLMEEKKIKKVEGVPILCRIPIIGLPFRRTSYQKVKTELAIFLTPKIITGDVLE